MEHHIARKYTEHLAHLRGYDEGAAGGLELSLAVEDSNSFAGGGEPGGGV